LIGYASALPHIIFFYIFSTTAFLAILANLAKNYKTKCFVESRIALPRSFKSKKTLQIIARQINTFLFVIFLNFIMKRLDFIEDEKEFTNV